MMLCLQSERFCDSWTDVSGLKTEPFPIGLPNFLNFLDWSEWELDVSLNAM